MSIPGPECPILKHEMCGCCHLEFIMKPVGTYALCN